MHSAPLTLPQASPRTSPFSLREAALELFQEAQAEKHNSKFSKFKEAWKRDSKKRLVLGLTLASGAVIATATGATAIAGAMLATRAAIGAIGGFLTTEAAFDLVGSKFGKDEFKNLLDLIERSDDFSQIAEAVNRIEESRRHIELEGAFEQARQKSERFLAIKQISAVTVGTVLGIIGGSHAAEAATNMACMPPAIPSPGEHYEAPKVTKDLMKRVFDDIRHDHPKQGYVTLEQSIRRIEGLRQGIPLEKSEALKALDSSVSHSVHNPNGKVGKIMEDLGYREHGESIDHVARKLNEEKISKIVERYYESSQPVREVPFAQPVSPAAITPISQPLSAVTTHAVQSESHWVSGSIAAATVAWAGLLAYQQYTKPRTNLSRAPHENHAQTNPGNPAPAPVQRTQNAEVETREADTVNESLANGFESEIANLLTSTCYGWHADLERTKEINGGKRLVFVGETVGGCFDIQVQLTGSTYRIAIIWYEDETGMHHEDSGIRQLNQIPSDENRERFLRATVDDVFFRLLDYRENLKTMQMRELHTVEIARADLNAIYEQLEHPEIVRNNFETGGWWFMDCYRLRDWKIQMMWLKNPRYEIIDSSSVHFQLKANDEGSYFYRDRSLEFASCYPPGEQRWLYSRWTAEIEEKPNAIFSAGMVFDYNWHKHCSEGFSYPSQQDMNHAESSPGRFRKAKTLQTHTWAILSPLTDPNFRPEPHQAVLGTAGRRYVLSFWAMNRKTENGPYGKGDLRKIRVQIVD